MTFLRYSFTHAFSGPKRVTQGIPLTQESPGRPRPDAENMKVLENTGICIFGIRPLCDGVNLPIEMDKFLVLVKIHVKRAKVNTTTQTFSP